MTRQRLGELEKRGFKVKIRIRGEADAELPVRVKLSSEDGGEDDMEILTMTVSDNL